MLLFFLEERTSGLSCTKLGEGARSNKKTLAIPLLFLRPCSDAYQTSAFIKSQILKTKLPNLSTSVLWLEEFSDLQSTAIYSVGPVHLKIGDIRLFTNHIFYDIHAHSVCLQKPQLIFPTMRKRKETIWIAVIAFI